MNNKNIEKMKYEDMIKDTSDSIIKIEVRNSNIYIIGDSEDRVLFIPDDLETLDYRDMRIDRSIKSLKVVGGSGLRDISNLFFGSSLESIDLSGLDTSNVENMSNLASVSTKLKSIDLSGLDTSKVRNMSAMFTGSTSLEHINISGLNTSNVENMAGMFQGCAMQEIDVSGFDTHNVVTMCCMFNNCTKLHTIDISNFSFEKVKDTTWMFSRCKELHSVGKIDIRKVWSKRRMFKDSGVIESDDIQYKIVGKSPYYPENSKRWLWN